MNRKRQQSRTFVVRVVRLAGNKLTIKIRNGKKRTYTLADEATIISGGMADTLDQIQIGQNIRVTNGRRISMPYRSLNHSETTRYFRRLRELLSDSPPEYSGNTGRHRHSTAPNSAPGTLRGT
jgi:hypothetical protein